MLVFGEGKGTPPMAASSTPHERAGRQKIRRPVSRISWFLEMGVSKNRGTPKWLVYNGKPYEQMDDLGVRLFLETPKSFKGLL